jgi:hypothetical protein
MESKIDKHDPFFLEVLEKGKILYARERIVNAGRKV